MLPRGPNIEFWTCFLEVRGFEFGHASQRSDGLILDVLPRGSMELEFGHASQRSDGLKFGCASRRSDGLKFRHAFQRSDGLKFGHAS